MTIAELRNISAHNTEIFIKSFEENSPKLKVNNYLMGNDSFRTIAISKIKAVSEDVIYVYVDMPIVVLNAWIKYSDEYMPEKYMWKEW